MDYRKVSLEKHYEWNGKIEINARAKVNDKDSLSLAYTPGVAEPCLEIQKDYKKSWQLTRRSNLVAVITDGSAVLGLGDIGPEAGMPVMEGKCVLFKEFGDVDAFPLCVRTKDVDEFVETVYNISGSFGGINLEDISAPRCFEIERRLIEECSIPVFHDDQHGTAIITCAALLNSIKLTGRKTRMGKLKIVINGAGAAGISIAKLILQMKFGNVILCNSKGAIYKGAPGNNTEQEKIAQITNLQNERGCLSDVIKAADIFIGVSKADELAAEDVQKMASDPIVFAMANPIPEIMPEVAKKAGAKIVGTGRSDYPNQINNVLVFPGIFRGLLDSRASCVTDSMKEAAARAIAAVVSDDQLSTEYILPDAFDERVARAVADAVIEEEKKLKIEKKGEDEIQN